MKGKQLILLFLALLVPSGVFIFLKIFGENQFDVAPLFSDQVPAGTKDCQIDYKLPYHLADSSMSQIANADDSLIIVIFQRQEPSSLNRVHEKYGKEPISWKYFDPDLKTFHRRCIFMVDDPLDVALIDNAGRIRGQYNSSDRDEVDRLATEIAILLKKY